VQSKFNVRKFNVKTFQEKPWASALAIGLALAATLTAQGGRGTGAPCDRVCLEGFINQYLDALMARNPFGLPLAAKVKFSENDQSLPLGDGLWNTVTGPGSYKLYVADPTRGQAGFLGTLRENGNLIAFSVRLKVEDRRISEIETTVLRESLAANGDLSVAARLEQIGTPDAMFVETVAPGRRQSRDALLAAANAHFDEIEHQQERTVYPRRFGVLDEERQLVFGSFMHQEAGDPERGTVPSFVDVTAVLRVTNGRIARAEPLMVGLPYGTPSPFFDGDWRKGNRMPIALPSAAVARPQVSAGPCDRACLEGHVDRYLAAMVAHDPKRLPVDVPMRFSENDVPLRLGDALWRTATAVGTYKLYVADPQAGQVGFFGTIRENGKPAALVLRLKVERGLITEAETLAIRSEGTANNLEKAGAPDPILLEPVPVDDRVPRTTLIATTNTYFEAIEQGNGAVAPFAAECNRFENGIRTSGAQGCSAQLDTHIFDYIQKIYPRRFMVVDEERQTVRILHVHPSRRHPVGERARPGTARDARLGEAAVCRRRGRALQDQGQEDPQGRGADGELAVRGEIAVRAATVRITRP
jgi:hypothetical protein